MTIEERNKMVEENLPLVKYALKKYVAYDSYDDLLQEGYFALIIAAQNFDASLGYAFSTYAINCIRLHVLKKYVSEKLIHLPAHIVNERCMIEKWIIGHPTEALENAFDKEICNRYREVNELLNFVYGDTPIAVEETAPYGRIDNLWAIMSLPAKDETERTAIQADVDKKVRDFYQSRIQQDEKKEIAERCYFDDFTIFNELPKNEIRKARLWYLNQARNQKMIRDFRFRLGIPEFVSNDKIPEYLYG